LKVRVCSLSLVPNPGQQLYSQPISTTYEFVWIQLDQYSTIASSCYNIQSISYSTTSGNLEFIEANATMKARVTASGSFDFTVTVVKAIGPADYQARSGGAEVVEVLHKSLLV
jgi:hypothetical protein